MTIPRPPPRFRPSRTRQSTVPCGEDPRGSATPTNMPHVPPSSTSSVALDRKPRLYDESGARNGPSEGKVDEDNRLHQVSYADTASSAREEDSHLPAFPPIPRFMHTPNSSQHSDQRGDVSEVSKAQSDDATASTSMIPRIASSTPVNSGPSSKTPPRGDSKLIYERRTSTRRDFSKHGKGRDRTELLTRPVLSDRRQGSIGNRVSGLRHHAADRLRHNGRLSYLSVNASSVKLEESSSAKGEQRRQLNDKIQSFLTRMEQQKVLSARKIEALRRQRQEYQHYEPNAESTCPSERRSRRKSAPRRTPSNSTAALYERGKHYIQERECRLEYLRRQLQQKELQQCTFRPHTSRQLPRTSKTDVTDKSSAASVSCTTLPSTRPRSANRYARSPGIISDVCRFGPEEHSSSEILAASRVSPCNLDRRIEELEAIALTDRSSAVYPESDRDRSEDVIADCLLFDSHTRPSSQEEYSLDDDGDERPRRVNRRLFNKWMAEEPRIPQFECIAQGSDLLVDSTHD
ncbi:hypothetical protein FOZ62_009576 [Perkinsus olseni]|uniref:Uncharacterized protein n=2 Tax=Perkinsus olseni TaxID=32597 RepID=A0A7J6TGW8_PEROL|nr:hypothetical protein FOZ62_009576 [Perkinsus olseni]